MSDGDLVQQPNDPQQLELWGQMVALERERIASADRRTEAMKAGFARIDAADERQFEFHSDRLRRNDEFRRLVLTTLTRMGWIGIIVAVAIICVLFWMAFWGDDGQRSTAIILASHVLTSTAFLGFGFMLGRRKSRS